ALPVFDAGTGLYEVDSNGNPITAQTGGAVYSPANRIEVSPRLDLQLGQKNTLTMRYQFERSTRSNNVGSTSLPSHWLDFHGASNPNQRHADCQRPHCK